MMSTKGRKAKSTTTEGEKKAKGKEPIDYHLQERHTGEGSTESSDTSLVSLVQFIVQQDDWARAEAEKRWAEEEERREKRWAEEEERRELRRLEDETHRETLCREEEEHHERQK